MAYTISNTDGSTLVLVPEKTVDEISTSLTLVGRNVNGFGEYINNNFVKLAANFANDSINPPRSPLKGQLWYDTTVKKLKLYDDGFKVIGGAVVSSTLPASLTTGDLWFDNTTNQLKLINSDGTLIIGPAFPLSVGENGWVLPATSVRDDNLRTKNVTFLKNYGNYAHAAVPIYDESKNLIATLALSWVFSEIPTSIIKDNNFTDEFKEELYEDANSLRNYLV